MLTIGSGDGSALPKSGARHSRNHPRCKPKRTEWTERRALSADSILHRSASHTRGPLYCSAGSGWTSTIYGISALTCVFSIAASLLSQPSSFSLTSSHNACHISSQIRQPGGTARRPCACELDAPLRNQPSSAQGASGCLHSECRQNPHCQGKYRCCVEGPASDMSLTVV